MHARAGLLFGAMDVEDDPSPDRQRFFSNRMYTVIVGYADVDRCGFPRRCGPTWIPSPMWTDVDLEPVWTDVDLEPM